MTDEKIQNTSKLPISIMAIVSLVIGIIAMTTSFVPIVNNASAFLAALGAIFGIVGVVGAFREKKRSKVLTVIAVAINVLAFIIVLATQNMYGQVLNDAAGNPATGTKGSSEAKFGEAITLNNDLEVTVVSVDSSLKNHEGAAITKVLVKYQNNGNKEISYNNYDWKAENSSGNQTSSIIYTDSSLKVNPDGLQSGKLAAGGSVSGALYFNGDVSKMLYSSSVIGDSKATWTK